eukprot:TRINITY_DN23267_c0_g1_i1.p1 TRINITY_DN23267_c0_g1~~TRINITY_DN23267_c0_g1_i1.p1  ORF type:complete len:270 (-),score=70.48 TRINITY_DN23267_c0_g1_i1:182-991(-)
MRVFRASATAALVVAGAFAETAPVLHASVLSAEEQYPRLAATLKEAGAELEAKYAQNGQELAKAFQQHLSTDKDTLRATIGSTTRAAKQGFHAVKTSSQGTNAAAFLQRRVQAQADGEVKVAVAGVPQPGKSMSRRVGRLARKWTSASDKLFAVGAKGFDAVASGINNQLQASLMKASDAALHAQLKQEKGTPASFLSAGDVDLRLSPDEMSWPVPSELILDLQYASAHDLVQAAQTIGESFTSLAKADTDVIREAIHPATESFAAYRH